jgi:hypothetical protein
MRRLLACATVVSALLIAACGPSEKVFGMEIGGADTTAVGVPSSVSVSLDIDSESGDRPGLDEMEAVKNYAWTVTPSDVATVGPAGDPRVVTFVAQKPGVYVITAVGLSGETKGMGATHTVTVLAPSPSPAPGATDDPTAATASPAPMASPEPTAGPTISFILSDGKVQASASSEVPGFGAAIAELEIRGTSGAEGSPVPFSGSVSNVPFTGQIPPWEPPYTATGDLSVQGTMDPATGAVTGTFTWVVPDLTISGEVTVDGVVMGQATLTMPYTWSGDITGTVGADTAEIAFSGSRKSTCKITTTVESGRNECTGPTGAFDVPVTFTVRIESATPNP